MAHAPQDECLRLLFNVDLHAPSSVRVHGPLSNMPAFADAFDVEPGAPLRRREDERLRIW